MTKTIKMSLVAAVAVAGLTTSASAANLEDSIKGVSINGKVEVGYNYADRKDNNTTSNEVEYDLDIQAKIPVNDMMTATVAVQADHGVAVDTNTTDAASVAKGDKVTLTRAYFTYSNNGTTVMAGKQSLNTPFDDDQRGDGIVGLTSVAGVTVAAAHFEGVNALPGTTVNAAAIIGAYEGINLSAWALSSTAVDGYTVNANGALGAVNFDARHTSIAQDVANSKNENLSKIVANTKVDNLTLIAGYGRTNVDNTQYGRGVQTESAADMYLDQIHLGDYADAKAILVGASVPMGATTFTALYLDATVGDSTDATELNLKASYAMSKNFTVSGLYSTAEIEAGGVASKDEDRMELSLLYTF